MWNSPTAEHAQGLSATSPAGYASSPYGSIPPQQKLLKLNFNYNSSTLLIRKLFRYTDISVKLSILCFVWDGAHLPSLPTHLGHQRSLLLHRAFLSPPPPNKNLVSWTRSRRVWPPWHSFRCTLKCLVTWQFKFEFNFIPQICTDYQSERWSASF